MTKFISKLWVFLNIKTKEAEVNFVIAGYLILFGFMGWYLIWHNIQIQLYENLSLRIIASTLALPLIFYNHWPQKLGNLKPIYWYLTMIYTMPFFFTFMLLKNNFSVIWQMNTLTAIVFLLALVDWLSFIVITAIGTSIALLSFYFSNASIYIETNILGTIANYAAVILFCGLFLHKKFSMQLLREKNKEQERIAKTETELRQSIMVLAGSIAHDLRTPLLVVRALAEVTGMAMPKLLFAYTQAQAAKLDKLEKISVMHLKKLPEIPEDLSQLVTEMNEYITISLKSLTQILVKDLKSEDLVLCSAEYCIRNTIKRYPLLEKERNLIHSNTQYQFEFKGNPVLVFRMLSNLIKNALEQIQKNQKGEIFIYTRDANTMNEICVKDTAGGVTPEIAKNLFSGYKTTKAGGTGVGLAFCKLTMETFQGAISAHCIENDCIEFTLSFPKL